MKREREGDRRKQGEKRGLSEAEGLLHRERIIALVDPLLRSEGMELVEVECLRMPSRWLVRVYMDREGGVTLDDCAAASNEIGDLLNAHDLPPGPYLLEVSSPGLDRPLVRDEDFQKYRGSRVRLKLRTPLEGRKNYSGILAGYVADGESKEILLQEGETTHRIPRDLVSKARLEYEIQ
jgi:ribosome maturation factor RimP